MRRVACYAAASRLADAEVGAEALEALVRVVESWLRARGLDTLVTGTTTFLQRKGGSATVDAQQYTTSGSSEWDMSVEEPTATGRFLTRIVLGCADEILHLFVELRAGAEGYQLAPMDVDVRCPQVLRDLLSTRTWTVGKTPVRVRPIHWTGQDGARRLLAVVAHAERNLPVVVVSEHEGQPLTASLPEDLARDLSGLVLVVHIDEAASWELTKIRGKEWSCYDGAIRVYWPIRRTSGSAFDHPYWTRGRLIDSRGSSAAAASGIRNELRRRLLELSTYAVDESRELARIRDDSIRLRFEEARKAAEESGNQGALAEEYFSRCAALEQRLADRDAKIDELKDTVQSLNQVWKYAESEKAQALPPEPEKPVETLADAVDRARSEFSSDLRFGEDVDDGVLGLVSDAGPPDKIFEQLKALAEMSRIRRSGSLGKGIFGWLADRGIAASNESEIVTGTKSEMQKRTWRDGSGRRAFVTHLKPNEGTGPDRCVRIYFEYDEKIEKLIVGWIGRHP